MLCKPHFHRFSAQHKRAAACRQEHMGLFTLLTAAPGQLPRPQGLGAAGPDERFTGS